MKVYKVGGAIRDKLIDYPFTDEDWVVVGAEPKELIDKGFIQVGVDFPVFLHPESKDEYALARSERKSGRGYKGFEFFTGPQVTLKQDLSRRDLTVNAMAEDCDGKIIDPYGGQDDLSKKILRHVSGAFVEDPLRVLRVARFAARYHHLGFKVADETMLLMTDITNSGELEYLSPERVWLETEKALKERSPSTYIEILYKCKALTKIFPEISRVFDLASEKDKIDGKFLTLSILNYAAKLDKDACTRFAVLFSNINLGSQSIPSNMKSIDEDIEVINNLFDRLKVPNRYRNFAINFVRYKDLYHCLENLEPQIILDMLKSIGAFKKAENLEKFIYCCEAEAQIIQKNKGDNKVYGRGAWLKQVLSQIMLINNRELISEGYSGVKLGKEIDRRRKKIIAKLLR
ncbi:multifunctional CCA addition/repair protein [bacterium]|nr:multifunctional CCA addition/repair protein [bacterium]